MCISTGYKYELNQMIRGRSTSSCTRDCSRFQSGNPYFSSAFGDFASFVDVDELVNGGWVTRYTDAEWETK